MPPTTTFPIFVDATPTSNPVIVPDTGEYKLSWDNNLVVNDEPIMIAESSYAIMAQENETMVHEFGVSHM